MRCCPTAPWPHAYYETNVRVGEPGAEDQMFFLIRAYSATDKMAAITCMASGFDIYKEIQKQAESRPYDQEEDD